MKLRKPEISAGSSPLTRGTLTARVSRNINPRFIPAYAGNSGEIQTMSCVTTVHPRLRGELKWQGSIEDGIAGSSPLTRGTQLHSTGAHAANRFIPAYAGNSLRHYG